MIWRFDCALGFHQKLLGGLVMWVSSGVASMRTARMAVAHAVELCRPVDLGVTSLGVVCTLMIGPLVAAHML